MSTAHRIAMGTLTASFLIMACLVSVLLAQRDRENAKANRWRDVPGVSTVPRDGRLAPPPINDYRRFLV